jgi:hypothetical protein
MDQKFIEERRAFLDLFIKKLATQKYLWYADEFDLFIHSNTSDMEKALSNLAKPAS